MCGITGFFAANDATPIDDVAGIVDRMTDALTHRGPDDRGVWLSKDRRVALGHRRLSVIDLSSAAHQPMISADGRYVLVFNGEVYNFHDLRDELSDHAPQLRGHGDTEVVLAAICHWGFVEAVSRFNGMFAIGLWDNAERCLWLARDRLGEKPLFFGWLDDTFVFGSELKSLVAHPGLRREIDVGALEAYLRVGYVPAPHCIYAGISKLSPGTVLRTTPKTPHRIETRTYWSLDAVARQVRRQPETSPEQTLLDELDQRLRDAVRIRLTADVPVGAFLSGGVDSSLIVALMKQVDAGSVRTFSIGFRETEFDEAPCAAAVARHLKTEHREFYVTPDDALATIERLPHIYDEPMADVSAIPTLLLAEMTRQHVTVSLSGDGGDELFGGYDRYTLGQRLWRRVRPLPVPLRRAAALLLRNTPSWFWDHIIGRIQNTILGMRLRGRPSQNARRLADLLVHRDFISLYAQLVSECDPSNLLNRRPQRPVPVRRPIATDHLSDPLSQMMISDADIYLPDDILVKVDRATMAVSLENRIPLLDHRIVEFAWQLPAEAPSQGFSKRPLRQLLHRYVTPELVDRPKRGFAVPISAWLRGPLRPWAQRLLASIQTDDGLLRPRQVQALWQQHQDGAADHGYLLWHLVMFLAWCERWNVAWPTRPATEPA